MHRPHGGPPPQMPHRKPLVTPTRPPQHGPWHLEAQQGQALILMPGQMYFGGRASAMRTLLGSCVAITLWHPGRRIGGMCHFLLPKRERKPGMALDGRYGDEALEAMMSMLRLTDTRPEDYHAHLYGGADTMPEGGGLRFNVGERNIEQGWSLIDQYGFQLQGVDVGEDIPRTVSLTLANGRVDMRRGSGHAPRDMHPAPTAPMPLDTAPAPFAPTQPPAFAHTAPMTFEPTRPMEFAHTLPMQFAPTGTMPLTAPMPLDTPPKKKAWRSAPPKFR